MSDDIIQWGPTPKRVTVTVDGTVVAQSDRAVALIERAHDPVYYFPPEDVMQTMLDPTDHHSHCPYKGDADYWSLAVNGEHYENAVWCYRNPIPMADKIEGLLAFWGSKLGPRFEIEVEG